MNPRRKQASRTYDRALCTLFVSAVLLFLGALGPQALAEDPQPRSENENAVWVAESGGVLKVGTADGAILFEVPGVANARSVAIDTPRLRAWVYAGGSLHAIDFSGHEVFSVATGAADAEHAQLAVSSVDGSVWLAVNRDVRCIGPEGQAFLSLRPPESVKAVAIDESAGQVWIGMSGGITAYDAISGAEVRTLDLAPGETLEDLAVEPGGGGLWLALKDRLRRLAPDGSRSWEAAIRGISLVAADSKGGAWAGAGKDLFHLLPSGEVSASVRPFGQESVLSALAVDPSTGGAWVSNAGGVAQVSSAGALVRSIALPPAAHVWDLAVYADLIPPTLEIDSPVDGSLLNRDTPEILVSFADVGSGVDASTLAFLVNGSVRASQCSAIPGGASCLLSSALPEGVVLLSGTLRDFAGNLSAPASVTFRVDVTPPTISIESPAAGAILDHDTPEIAVAFADQISGVDASSLLLLANGAPLEAPCTPTASGASCLPSSPLTEGEVVVSATVRDLAGNLSAPASVSFRIELSGGGLPPDPATVATAIDPTVPTDIAAATEFLYAGSRPIQAGVAEGAIEPYRVAILRGRVLDQEGNPLPGVTITLRDHPEVGSTVTRRDGVFDMALNGGGAVVVRYELAGYFEAQRTVPTPWRDYVLVDDVVLVRQDPVSTLVTLDTPAMQVARGSAVEDADGHRQATLLFPANTSAELVFADGSRQAVPALTVRATEYTVGERGPLAMPAPLPAATAYTYAVELSADEAIAAGATSVALSQPAILYLENFLDFPVGGIAPAGFYDRALSSWVPSDNGRVVKLLAITGGLAEIDVDGSGRAATTAALAAMGIGSEELRHLATLYIPGQSLWRVPIPHFTPCDVNWPYYLPNDAATPPNPDAEQASASDADPNDPNPGEPDPTGPDAEVDQDAPAEDVPDPCLEAGSILECENQVLGQSLQIAGVPFAIHYRSSRAPEYRASASLKVRLRGRVIPVSLKRIDLIVDVAGVRQRRSFSPAIGRFYTFEWDGKDIYGRPIIGRQLAHVKVGFVYDFVRVTPDDQERFFGMYSSSLEAIGSAGRGEYTYWNETTRTIYRRQPIQEQLAGWSLGPHASYDVTGGIVLEGNGRARTAGLALASSGLVVKNLRSTGQVRTARIGADGSLYYIERSWWDGRMRLYTNSPRHGNPNSPWWTFSGSASQQLSGIAVAEDDTFYFSAGGCGTGPVWILRKRPGQGNLETVYSAAAGCFYDLELATDGSLLAATRSAILRIETDGSSSILAGGGTETAERVPARRALIDSLINLGSSLAIAGDGTIYFSDYFNGPGQPSAYRVRRIRGDGLVETVAPGGSSGIAVTSTGELVVNDAYQIALVTKEGVVFPIAGTGTYSPAPTEGMPALAANMTNASVDLAPDGGIVVVDFYYQLIRRLEPAFPGYAELGSSIASEDGLSQAEFDTSLRHVRTVDTRTGSTIYSFRYDAAGHLLGISDANHRETRIERAAGGVPTAIVSPEGQRTVLQVGATGFLEAVTNPAGETTRFTYSPGGLMTSRTDARTHRSDYVYSPKGRLIQARNAAGGAKSFVRTWVPGKQAVTMTTAAGRRTTYQFDTATMGTTARKVTATSGLATTRSTDAAGVTTRTRPDGTIAKITLGPDPRFGMVSPIPSTAEIRLPSGLTFRATSARTADSYNLRDTVTVNGRTATRLFDSSSRTLTWTSPAGRQRSALLDNQARPLELRVPGIEPVRYQYDASGHLTAISQGTGVDTRAIGFGYDALGRVETMTDTAERQIRFGYDAANRPIEELLPAGRRVAFDWDENGNLQSLTPPGRPAHGFAYTPVDLLERYDPPSLGSGSWSTSYDYDADKKPTAVAQPDRAPVILRYDAAQRLSGISSSRGLTSLLRGSTGQVTRITTPEGNGLDFTYDGFVPVSTSWTGEIAGSVTRSYDTSLRVASVSVDGANPVWYSYDADGMVTGVGWLTLTRSSTNGLLTGTSLGLVTTSYGRSSFGELASATAATAGTPIFSATYARDRLGRIIQKREMIFDVTTVYDYGYDAAGRLEKTWKNGTLVSQLSFDANGNRLTETTPLGTTTATYDDQDRLVNYGGTTFTYAANGELLTRTDVAGTTRYETDAFGNLLSVELASGTRIDYVIDGENRRIGKKVGGALVRGFLYQGQLSPAAELDEAGTVVSRFVYATRVNVPDYMVKNGITYRLINDHLGSVRLVISTADGAIAQRLDYDTWGRVLFDSNPDFQPFGFAGGLYDSDSGLVRFGARDYDPRIGRWLSKDPVLFRGGSSNLINYLSADPLNRTDPRGLAQFCLRPLEHLPWIPGWSSNEALDRANLEVAHEQLFFEDGSGEDLGYYDDSRVKPDKPENLPNYRMCKPDHYDDDLMREAIAAVGQPDPFSAIGSNCQAWADRVRDMYLILENEAKSKGSW